MSELFTVKLDLSDIIQSESERFYILLVDPTKMKMIYQFKLWIRFLFSVDSLINLVYENATIHDLEDIHILSVLKTIKVKRMKQTAREQEQQEKLLAKLNKYNEWCEKTSSLMTPENSASFVSLSESFQTELTGTPNMNLVNTCEKKTQQQSFTYLQDMSFSEEVSNSIDCKRSKTDCDNINNGRPNSISCDTQRVGNQSAAELFETSRKCDVKHNSTLKRRSMQKPFSLYHFLKDLRNEANGSDNTSTINTVPEDNHEVNMETGNENEKEDMNLNLDKKKKKRIRRHKSKKAKLNDSLESIENTLSESYNCQEDNISTASKTMPKHIRFDADNKEFECAESYEDSYNGVENHLKTETHENVEVKGFNESMTIQLKELFRPEPKEKNVENEKQCFEVNENKSNADSNVAINLMDVFGNLKKQSKTPLVIDRFDNH